MASSSPLTGVVLVDCARANASSGLAIASQQCGYGDDRAAFQAALKAACQEMKISATDLADLIDEPTRWPMEQGMEVAPDTPDDL